MSENLNKTFALIKPDAVENGHIGGILTYITENGFRIAALQLKQLSLDEAEMFYDVHRNKDFYKGLTEFLASGNVVGMLLEKENAVTEFRNLVPKIREIWGTSTRHNAIHGSDSDDAVMYESTIFFIGAKK